MKNSEFILVLLLIIIVLFSAGTTAKLLLLSPVHFLCDFGLNVILTKLFPTEEKKKHFPYLCVL